jgi:rubrerythrin
MSVAAVLEFAKQMENDGEQYYRDLGARCEDKGLATILNLLADAEVSHYNVLKDMADGLRPTLPETSLVSDIKNVFVQMKEEGKPFNFDISHVDMYKKAQDHEKKSEEFYRQKADAAEDAAEKEILMRLAAEERQHYLILGNMVDFLSRPTTWLENAEWHHLDEY